MSDPNEQQEPSMEEILASIRRIISEDDVEMDDDEADAGEQADVVDEAPDVEASVAEVPPPPEDEAVPEEVLELTEVVEEDGSVVSMADDEEPEVEAPAPEMAEVPAPKPAPELEGDLAGDTLVSEDVGAQTASAFLNFSRTITSGYEGDGKTLEDLVEAMLRPMLKSWLDRNLPGLVEKLVAEEIARLAAKR